MIPKADFSVFRVTCHLTPGGWYGQPPLGSLASGKFCSDFLNRKKSRLLEEYRESAFMGMLTECQDMGCPKGTLGPFFPLPLFSLALYRGCS